MSHYSPPAKATFNWWKLLFCQFLGKKENYTQAITGYTGSVQAWVGDAWVPMLAIGLRSIASIRPAKKLVVLPAYSCNEFVKAILLADLEPCFVDIDGKGRFNASVLQDVDSAQVLAVLAVNTTGVVGQLEALKAWCEENHCYLVEDAGYTFLGTDEKGKPFGTWGHATIINMSEGKIIPCGGAAWLVNTPELLASSSAAFQFLEETDPKSNLMEALQLALYKIGSSRLVYHGYQVLRQYGLADLKARMTAEPSRRGENYATGNLEWINGRIELDVHHAKELNSIKPRPWNHFRQACAVQILKNRHRLIEIHRKRVKWWKEYKPEGLICNPLPERGMPVRLPVLLDLSRLSDNQIHELASLGIKKQYPATWPMYHLPFPHSKLFYEQAYALPLHSGMIKRDIHELSLRLKTLLFKNDVV